MVNPDEARAGNWVANWPLLEDASFAQSADVTHYIVKSGEGKICIDLCDFSKDRFAECPRRCEIFGRNARDAKERPTYRLIRGIKASAHSGSRA